MSSDTTWSAEVCWSYSIFTCMTVRLTWCQREQLSAVLPVSSMDNCPPQHLWCWNAKSQNMSLHESRTSVGRKRPHKEKLVQAFGPKINSVEVENPENSILKSPWTELTHQKGEPSDDTRIRQLWSGLTPDRWWTGNGNTLQLKRTFNKTPPPCVQLCSKRRSVLMSFLPFNF